MKNLIKIGLIITPFAFIPSLGFREPKFLLALAVSICLILKAVYDGSLKPILNIPYLLFLGFCSFSWMFNPPFSLQCGDFVLNGSWRYEAMFYIFIFSFAIFAIAGQEFKEKEIHSIFNIISWVGFVMAVYMLFQKFGIDQWFHVSTTNPDTNSVPSKELYGFIGQPTLAGAFLSLCFPFSVGCRHWGKALLIAALILMTQSKMALFGLITSLIVMVVPFKKIPVKTIIFSIIILSFVWIKSPEFRKYSVGQSCGRLTTWSQVFNDSKQFNVFYTGFGAGSFPVFFMDIHKDSRFDHAHNEFIEIFHDFGFVGFFLFLLSVFMFIQNSFGYGYGLSVLLASLSASITNALGSFHWHIGSSLFLTIVTVGMLLSLTRKYQSGGI